MAERVQERDRSWERIAASSLKSCTTLDAHTFYEEDAYEFILMVPWQCRNTSLFMRIRIFMLCLYPN